MIQTITIPTARLGSGSRLLLNIKGSPHAFTEAQLVDAVLHANESMLGVLRALGLPQPSPFKDRAVVSRPVHDASALEQFKQAYEWLSYQGIVGPWGADGDQVTVPV